MLLVSGALDQTMGGKTYPDTLASDYQFEFKRPVRSVYVPVFRNSLPEMFEAFDFANPSMVTGRRNSSTVAPQALFLMNHPFVREQAQRTAERLLAMPMPTGSERVRFCYLTLLARPATDEEVAISETFLAATAADSTLSEAWTQLVQSLFASLDFRYVR
jgi:hypothetical protein